MNKNCKLKIPSALLCTRRLCAVVTLCMVCSLIFMSSGCGNKSTFDEGSDENKDNPYYCYVNLGNGFVKEYLSLYPKYISLTLKEPQLPVDIEQRGFVASEFQLHYFDRWPDKVRDCLYWTKLDIGKVLEPMQYFELLSDIKQKNRDIIVGSFFTFLSDKEQKGRGTGHFFYVKLNKEEDLVLLEQMTEQTGCVILEETGGFQPLAFYVSVTEDTEMNALECANIFYESGLFQTVDMTFMHDVEGSIAL